MAGLTDILKVFILLSGSTLSLLLSVESSGDPAVTTGTSHGVEYETDESWLVYQKVAPIIYKFDSPSAHKDILKEIFARAGTSCPKPPSASNGKLKSWMAPWCPLLTPLRQLGNYLESIISIETIESAPESSQPYFIDYNCDRIMKSFPSLKTDETVLEDYIQNLKSCTGSSLVIEEEGFHGSNTTELNFLAILKSIRDSYDAVTRRPTDPIAAIINSEVIELTLGFLTYFAENQKWKDIISDCKAGTIPSSLVQKTQFQDSLDKLEKVLRDKYDQRLVIGSTDSEISSYYKYKLTDCTFSGTKFIVRILVPVKQNTQQLHQVKSLPFLSTMTPPHVCYISDFKNDKNLVYDFVFNSIIESDCVDKSELCYSPLFPNSNAFFNQNECAKALFSYPINNETFEAACSVDCESISDFNTTDTKLPLIRKMARNSYHIVGEPNKSFVIETYSNIENSKAFLEATVFDQQLTNNQDGKNETILQFPSFGALQVTLPCNSILLIQTKEENNLTFFSMNPCQDELEIKNVQLYQLASK